MSKDMRTQQENQMTEKNIRILINAYYSNALQKKDPYKDMEWIRLIKRSQIY